jgi:hypothetical protein
MSIRGRRIDDVDGEVIACRSLDSARITEAASRRHQNDQQAQKGRQYSKSTYCLHTDSASRMYECFNQQPLSKRSLQVKDVAR